MVILVSLSSTPVAVDASGSQITTQWLNQQLVQWKPAQNSSLSFGALYQRASYSNISASYNTMSVEAADLSMLDSTGASCIRIDMDFAAWLNNNQKIIGKDDSVAANVKQANGCLIIADAASTTYAGTGNRLTWSAFKAAWVQRVQTLAQRYQPAYYVVIKEPGWYAQFVSDALTNPLFQNASDWANLAQQLVSAVQGVSPGTKTIVAVSGSDLASYPAFYVSFLQKCESIVGLQALGFDLYNTVAFTATQGFLSTYGNGGKEVWVAEAWSGPGSIAYSSSRASLDKEWMLVLYYFAQQIHAQAVIPFYTNLFVAYGTWPTNPTTLVSMYQGNRTPVFFEFSYIVAHDGRQFA